MIRKMTSPSSVGFAETNGSIVCCAFWYAFWHALFANRAPWRHAVILEVAQGRLRALCWRGAWRVVACLRRLMLPSSLLMLLMLACPIFCVLFTPISGSLLAERGEPLRWEACDAVVIPW